MRQTRTFVSNIGWKPTSEVLVASALVSFFAGLFEFARKKPRKSGKSVSLDTGLEHFPIPVAALMVLTNSAQIREVLARKKAANDNGDPPSEPVSAAMMKAA